METSKAIRDFLTMIGRMCGAANRKNLAPAKKRRLARKAANARWTKKQNMSDA
jgi:hypothetical protein